MEHVVFWSAPSGAPEFARVKALPEAVELVERLRNRDGITDATVHALTDVPVAFRTYYVAEVGAVPGAGEHVTVPSVAPVVAVEAPELDKADARPEATPAAGQVGPPALSVVPDMLETSPEPEPEPDAAPEPDAEPDPAAEPTLMTVAEVSAGPIQGLPRSLGLFA